MATFSEISTGGILGSGSATDRMIYNGNYEFFVCLRDNSQGAINQVSIRSEAGSNVYVFNNKRGTRYGVINGTYKFNIPQAQPIAFHTSGKTGVSYTGQNLQGTKLGLDGINYQFFWGEVTLTITDDFGLLSYQSWNGSYLGGFANIDYTPTCQNNNLKARSADVAAGSPSTVYFNSRYRFIVQSFGVFTTTNEVRPSLRQTLSVSGGARLGGTTTGIKNPIVSTVSMKVGGEASVQGGVLQNPIVKGGKTAGLLSSPTGGVVWQNANNVLRENELQSTTAIFNSTSGATNFLYVSNFNFDLPEFAVPTGCSARIKKSSSTGEVFDENIKLILNDSVLQVSDNKASPDLWPRVSASVTYGGSNDTWGFDLTRGNLVNPNFGIIVSILGEPALNSTAAIDYIELSIFYYQVVEATGSGGSKISGAAEVQVYTTDYIATGGCKASGISLVAYANIDGQGGAILSGQVAPDTSVVGVQGARMLAGGSGNVGVILNGNIQSVVLLRSSFPYGTDQNITNDVTVRPIGPSWRGEWIQTNYQKGQTVRFNNLFYICLASFEEGNGVEIDPEDWIANYGIGDRWAVYSGSLSYVFGNDHGPYGVVSNIYRFNVPASHPIAFLNFGRPSIQFTGTQPIGSKVASDGQTYTFYYGTVTLSIAAGWNRLPFSYESWANGYLGGLNNIIYSAAAAGQNTDVILGATSSVDVFAEKIPESGVVCSGIASVSLTHDEPIESYGAIASGQAGRSDSVEVGGGVQASGQIDLEQTSNIIAIGANFVINGAAELQFEYSTLIESQGCLAGGSGVIGIQPLTGEGSALLSGESSRQTTFSPILVGYAQIGGSYVLQQTYNSTKMTGYARVSPKSRSERLKKLIKTQLNYGLSMATENILNRVPEDPNKILRSSDSDQPTAIEETSYRLQHEPGWCDIGDDCGSAYLPQIVKKRQGRYLPSKERRAVASRQIATMTEG
jgi:hypothetical protein